MIVILIDPVAAVFDHTEPLNFIRSEESCSVIVPVHRAAVTLIRLEVDLPLPPRHQTAERDTQRVVSQPVEPVRACKLDPLIPNPAPYTVTLAEPVLTNALALLVVDKNTASNDMLEDADPKDPALDVMIIRAEVARPPEGKHRTVVSVSHSVASHVVCPARLCAVYVPDPTLRPYTVMLIDPVRPTFAWLT